MLAFDGLGWEVETVYVIVFHYLYKGEREVLSVDKSY